MPPTSRKSAKNSGLKENQSHGTQQPRQNSCSDDDAENASESQGDDLLRNSSKLETEELNQNVKRLVRYALACEYQRLTIKRAGIVEKVIGKQRCNFKLVFETAQKRLRDEFGLEMVELPSRVKITLKEKKAAQKQRAASKSSSTYILKSTLPPEYRKPEIISPPINHSQSDEAAYMGIYTVIICLIRLSADGQISSHQLEKYLKRLNLDKNCGIGTTSDVLVRMKKDNYLHEYKVHDDELHTSEWRVGPRGLVEIDSEAIAKFIHEIYGDSISDQVEKRLQRSLALSSAIDSETLPGPVNDAKQPETMNTN
ncbi:hypothetical protein BGHDH14_bgh04901 [Blumeria hordei DH14]|uniref:MAGE domain-containing protein n=1 Tax=Blumeria graminis f. sp. hordei (strain DH14) TaxID=546991 RepID=N1JC50_BLUG1|nr:hypothetical protein BGHDH14_bgh04901 [Blumeria hordei DH14]